LDVYKITFQLTVDIYKITEKFPKEELFGLTSQMRRAVISINSNLVEGASRGTSGEYKHFVGIARGSAAELKYQIKIASHLGFINENISNNLIEISDRICQMLTGLMNKIGK